MQDGELTPDDLLLMCKLGSLLTSRSINECISHKESLQRGHDLATQWLHPTAEPVELLENRTSKPLSPCRVYTVSFRVCLFWHHHHPLS